VGVAHCWNKSQ